ncbi:alpha/beta hydrolase [Kribbella sandramycini]|uniref:Pimeloyl-ACP methyl ester carboxylesterase n=1 Tax=Kribbella sandramycini TaxID=60450 RepID=A0A841RYX3_9ACTN|nr:alpha/beta hydrolase [Kribbella sandramycini]MBB6565178.1 pimeloyl-ACP methyl ester carboxylesterase [Kribbella sandramycini]
MVPLQCARVPVPLDYGKPGGATIDIMVSRLVSSSPARRGVLLTNPGGPGAAGLSMPAELATLGMPASVLNRYDVVGMDPRGVGLSAPVSCGFAQGQAYAGNIPPYPADAAAVTRWAGVVKGVADQCATNDHDDRLRFMSTANTARDMDTIRAALGEEKLSYFGGSYGTALGAAYASLFPQRTDRVVLDSNSGDTVLTRESQRRFGLGAEQRFPDFAKFAANRSTAYGLGRTPAEVRRNFLRFAEQLETEPVLGYDGATFRIAVFAGIYADQDFPKTAQLWQSLKDHQPNLLSSKAETPSPYDNSMSAYLAVVCNDSAWPRDLAAYQRDVKDARQRYPLFGAAGANITPCAFWHHAPAEPPVKISQKGPANILILQNLRDPATPHVGGVLLRKAFGDRARLVSVDQGGHGAYVYSSNACVLNVATAFLVDGKRPRHDLRCDA